MPEGFQDATDAALARLEALTGGEHAVIVDFERIPALFVGLDVDPHLYRALAETVTIEYGNPVITELAEALERDEGNRFMVGYHVGRQLSRAINGAFALGVLIGELHREQEVQRLKREATSDDG